MHYHAYEMAHVLMAPWRLATRAIRAGLDFPLNPFSATWPARTASAACGVFESLTRRYGKPEFAIDEIEIDGLPARVREDVVVRKAFCHLLHFVRDPHALRDRNDPKVLLVAPLSGHYATLLRGTVRALLADHDVYVTDWVDARDVPLMDGEFGLDDFIDYLIEFMRLLGPDLHVIAVCQPTVPALCATALLSEAGDDATPISLTLMGGPIDSRISPTSVNRLAEQRSLAWFESNILAHVPFPNPGFMRKVYPGFLQLTGFMTMNLERHASAHIDLFGHLVRGDEDSARQHNDFYEEYLAVMDLPARFYLDTIERVFQQHLLPRGKFVHRGRTVDCGAIRHTALLTIEGERDDICGRGQTSAALALCPNLPAARRAHHLQPGVGHYGVFNGSRFRREVLPRVRDWIRTAATAGAAMPAGPQPAPIALRPTDYTHP